MTQAVDSALERILLTEPSSGTKAMPSDIVGCAAEYVPGQGWIGNLGVLDSKAVLDSFPTNALVPGKVWAVVASASSFAKYNYMSAGWVVESSVGPTGSSNLPGSPSNPFTSTAERDAWATANLATLLPGRTTAWGPGNVEYVWNGPLATDWRGIRGPYLGSAENPFATAEDLNAAYPTGGPYQAFSPSVANPLSPRGSTLAHWNGAKWVPLPGQLIAQWKGVGGAPVLERTAAGLTLGQWAVVWAPDNPLPDWLICNPGQRIGSLIDAAIETYASTANVEHRYSIRTAPQVGGDIFSQILSGSGSSANARRGFGQAEVASTINPGGTITGVTGNAPYNAGGFNSAREAIGTWALGQTKPYISLKPGAETDSIKIYSVQIWARG